MFAGNGAGVVNVPPCTRPAQFYLPACGNCTLTFSQYAHKIQAGQFVQYNFLLILTATKKQERSVE